MKKKLLPLVILILVLPLVGLGCKGLSKEEQAATQRVTLEYWTVFDDVDAMQAQIDKYKADRPYLTINLKQLRVDEIYPRLLEALAEDRGPDIISVRNRWMTFYKPKLAAMPGSVSDTTVRVEKTTLGTKTTVSTVNQNLLTPNQLEKEYVQAVKNDVIMDNQIYGLPLSLENMALYYNKDLLDRANIAEPPKTWEDFQEAVKKITKFDRTSGNIVQAGTALGTGNNISGFEDIIYILFKQSGVNLIKDGRVNFSTRDQANPAISVMNFYTDFANSSRDTYAWNEDMAMSLDKFINGSLAFFFGYSYHYPVIKARAPQLNMAVLPMLQLNPEQPVNVANYWVQAVTDKSKHKNEAWALLNYLAHSKVTKDYLEQSGRPAALRAYIAGQLDNDQLYPFASQVLISDSWYKGKDYDATVKAMADMTHEWLLPAPEGRELQWKQEVLNRAASKINQTF
ncbi:MAG: extracellular solute-binding protein [Candidatus Magasanikbacteria bacterium]|nr:extracellular solute-binding protein [Candidatus Magasanikbacteria bacterium]